MAAFNPDRVYVEYVKRLTVSYVTFSGYTMYSTDRINYDTIPFWRQELAIYGIYLYFRKFRR